MYERIGSIRKVPYSTLLVRLTSLTHAAHPHKPKSFVPPHATDANHNVAAQSCLCAGLPHLYMPR
jgi:hypothetical protein